MTIADILKRAREGKNVPVPPLAEAVGLSVNGLYAVCRRGEVETIRIGNRVLIPGREALRILGAGETAAA